jgi:hypothetical protein
MPSNSDQVDFGTEGAYENSAQWRIPNGLSALWAILLGSAILFMPESPRFAYRQGRTEEARNTLAKLNGLDSHSPLIEAEIAEIEEKLEAAKVGGDHKWTEIFTAPRMLVCSTFPLLLFQSQLRKHIWPQYRNRETGSHSTPTFTSKHVLMRLSTALFSAWLFKPVSSLLVRTSSFTTARSSSSPPVFRTPMSPGKFFCLVISSSL